jgi:hypothetical protein
MANVGNTELAAKVPAAVDKKFLRFISLEYHISDKPPQFQEASFFPTSDGQPVDTLARRNPHRPPPLRLDE